MFPLGGDGVGGASVVCLHTSGDPFDPSNPTWKAADVVNGVPAFDSSRLRVKVLGGLNDAMGQKVELSCNYLRTIL
jgi:hypothetical protein